MTLPDDVYFGFDSAWTDKASAPGAICALEVCHAGGVRFHEPRLVRFSGAIDFIERVRSSTGCNIVALDQPTIVPNLTSMRPVERTVATLISWLGGGVQPSNRGKVGMFCDNSPVWPFLETLGATESPEESRTASSGLFLIEVFPALALASLDAGFFGRLAAPRYNPARRKTFKLTDWRRVALATAAAFTDLQFGEPAAWCLQQVELARPTKADQDRLDSMLCLLVALRWRLRPRSASMMLGCLDHGYMVTPVSPEVRERLLFSGEKLGLPLS